MALQAGQLVAERYRVGPRVGHGGTADVHVATDERLGRRVALKVLARASFDGGRAVARLRQEGWVVAALNHPNVVTIHDVVTLDGGDEVLVMELVEGHSLAERLRAGPLPLDEALEVARDVAAGLAAAHDEGVVHHDVKPSNVLFAPTGIAKVVDFGIARAVADETTTVLGTPAYVAPEQARGEPSDPRSDLYSLGCLLVEMVTGHPPFPGPSPAAMVDQHCQRPAPRLGQLLPAVPHGLDELVASLLAKHPDRRPASADLVVDALHALSVPSGDAARPPRVGPPRAVPSTAGRTAAPDDATTVLGAVAATDSARRARTNVLPPTPADPGDPDDAHAGDPDDLGDTVGTAVGWRHEEVDEHVPARRRRPRRRARRAARRQQRRDAALARREARLARRETRRRRWRRFVATVRVVWLLGLGGLVAWAVVDPDAVGSLARALLERVS